MGFPASLLPVHETAAMKRLPKKIGPEIWLNPDYAIARFTYHKTAFKTLQNQKMILTFKLIQEKNLDPQVQVHLRFLGRDLWEGKEDILNIDFYIPLTEWKKLEDLL
jgi:hypothetical protein